MREYTIKDGEVVLFFLRKTISPTAELIGSLGRGHKSDNDIDIHLPNTRKTKRMVNHLISLLEPKRGVTHTDWGGLYLHDTFFGDVDIFFKGCTEEFTY